MNRAESKCCNGGESRLWGDFPAHSAVQRVGPPKQETKMTDHLLTPKEVADLLKVTTDTLESWRAKRLGPAFIKLGEGKRSLVRYRRSALDEYLKAGEA